MAKAPKTTIGLKIERIPIKKKTTIGKNDSMIKKSSLNKDQRRSYKKYRGQGK
ncbi:MAG: hypothetical protein VW496_05390 [Pelagibacteraceae bacterium]|jgi:hypothetical protein